MPRSLAAAAIFSIAEALKQKGNRVLYFGAYKKKQDLYKRKDIERSTDLVIWSVDEGDLIEPRRPQDRSFRGNIVQAIDAYGSGALGEPAIPLADVDHLIAIGSDGMMNAVGQARHGVLAGRLKPQHKAIGSINSPMQCMMKEICAQCLQTHKDPISGVESVVFSCFNQDQEMDQVDFPALRRRLSQNGAQEKLTKLWIDRCLHHLGERPAMAAE